MFFVTGTSWQLGVLLLILANLCLGGSLVIYDSLLCRIAEPDERDRVSSRGWALGYLGGGLLLALNLVLVTLHDQVGLVRGRRGPGQPARPRACGGPGLHPHPRARPA